VAFAEDHPEAGMIGPCLIGSDGRVQASTRSRPTVATFLHRTCLLRWTGLLRSGYRRYRRQPPLTRTGPRQVDILMGAAVLVSRNVFFASGGWDEDYTFGGEDFDLSLRIGKERPLFYLPGVAVIHHGRAGTRANVPFSAPHVAIGFARFLRKSGTGDLSMVLYKAIVILDAPLHLAVKAAQWFWRSITGRRAKARQSLQRVKEQWYFLSRGLGEFWRV
jgi:hypothetical protein